MFHRPTANTTLLALDVVAVLAVGVAAIQWYGAAHAGLASLLAAPVLLWRLLPGELRTRETIGWVSLGVLVALYAVSQIGADPIPPPPLDWAAPFLVMVIPTIVVAWFRWLRRRGDKRTPIGPFALTSVTIMVVGCCGLNLAAVLAMGDPANTWFKVKPSPAEVLPLPDGWTVREIEIGGGNDPGFGISIVADGSNALALAQHLDETGWTAQPCRSIDGIFDWGAHCLVSDLTPTGVTFLLYAESCWWSTSEHWAVLAVRHLFTLGDSCTYHPI